MEKPDGASCDKKQWQCDLCQTYFRNRQTLKTHLLNHIGKRPYSCSYCAKTFTQSGHRNVHEQAIHFPKPPTFKCNECSKAFSQKGSLKAHLRTHTGERPFSCTYCEATFKQSGQRNVHEKAIHSKDSIKFNNEVCGKIFDRKDLLKSHMRIHTKERPYPCSSSSKTFSQMSGLKSHVCVHTNERPYPCTSCKASFKKLGHKNVHERKILSRSSIRFKCDVCSKTFDQKSSLESHVLTHIGEQTYSCSYCEATFTSKSGRSDHERLLHTKSPKEFTCDICSQKCSRKQTLIKHMRIHTDKRPFACSYCRATFTQPGHRNVHERTIHKNAQCTKSQNVFKCDVCKKTFGRKDHLKSHVLVHTGERPYSCSFCGATFTQSGQKNKHERTVHSNIPIKCNKTFTQKCHLKPHMLFHTGEQLYYCSYCSKEFKKRSKLNEHLRIHTGERPYSCSYCGATFTRSRQRNEHEQAVHSGNPMKCDICNKTFSQKGHLKSHMLIHTGERPYSCSYCDATFRQTGQRNKHQREVHLQRRHQPPVHSGNSVKFKCNVCSKTFSGIETLKYHMRNHTGERPYSCSYCQANFTLLAHKNTHERTQHSKESVKFKCDVCSKQFGQLYRLRRHVFTHTGERPYSCSYCEATFKQSGHRNQHERTKHSKSSIKYKCEQSADSQNRHKNGRPIRSSSTVKYKCDVCSKTFSIKTSLKYHMRTHTGERPYSCSHCQAAFTQSGHRNLHERTVHSKNRVKYKCDVCGETFGRKSQLKSHTFTHTNEQPYSCSYNEPTVTQTAIRIKEKQTVHSQNSHKHERQIKSSSLRNFKCDVCSKTFSLKTTLKYHMRVHTGERPYSCSLSKTSVSQPASTKKHKRPVHSENRYTHKRLIYSSRSEKFKCDLCIKTFNMKATLIYHMRVHTGERPYSCSHSEATFSQSGHRREHEGTVNSKNKIQFKCDVCSKTFGRKCLLKTHKRIHTGRRSYYSSYSEATVTEASNRNSNEQIVHLISLVKSKYDACHKTDSTENRRVSQKGEHGSQVKTISCDLCDKEFVDSQGLLDHTHKSHPDLDQQTDMTELLGKHTQRHNIAEAEYQVVNSST